MDEFLNSVKNETLGVGQYSFYNLQAGTAGVTTIKTGNGFVSGLIVNSFNGTTTVGLTDGTTFAAGNLITSSMIVAATGFINLGQVRYTTGLTIGLTGTAFVTVVYK